MNDKQSFMEWAANFIINGSLSKLKLIVIGSYDINRFLLPGQIIHPVPSASKIEVCHSICGPTMLILAVLCERPDIVKFLLSYNPDLLIKVNGYNALHYASLTKDTECLKILLTCSVYQKNIAIPISELNVENSTTNSLHIAVSNRNIASVALLLDELPKSVEYFVKQKNNIKHDTNADSDDDEISKNKDYKFEENEDDDVNSDDNDYSFMNEGIDVNSISSNGSTPLHIAAYMRDFEMCRLLLHYSADVSIRDSKGRTAHEIALNSHSKAGNKVADLLENIPEEMPRSLFQDQYPTLNNPPQRVFQITEKPLNRKSINLGSKTENKKHSSSSSDSSFDSDNENINLLKNKKKKKVKEDKETQRLLRMLLQKVDRIGARLSVLEDSVLPSTKSKVPVNSQLILTHRCIGCKSPDSRLCPTCHHYFCSKCINLPRIHNCV